MYISSSLSIRKCNDYMWKEIMSWRRCTCGSTLGVPKFTNASWKLEESNRKVQQTYVLVWVS